MDANGAVARSAGRSTGAWPAEARTCHLSVVLISHRHDLTDKCTVHT